MSAILFSIPLFSSHLRYKIVLRSKNDTSIVVFLFICDFFYPPFASLVPLSLVFYSLFYQKFVRNSNVMSLFVSSLILSTFCIVKSGLKFFKAM